MEAYVIMTFCILSIASITVFLLVRQGASDNERYHKTLELQQHVASLEHLKTHIDPHFLFNSLHTLNHLVEADPAKARVFIHSLSNTYSHILRSKNHDFIPLLDELKLANEYITLMKIRYGEETIQYVINVSKFRLADYYVPPSCLQILLENCFKHNSFSVDWPLKITLNIDNDHISLANEKKMKQLLEHSHGLGLKTLKDQFLLLTGRPIFISEDDSLFEVSMPLHKL
jgi:two-component system LytT family sensor kinase